MEPERRVGSLAAARHYRRFTAWAFPPFNMGQLAWLSLVPLLFAIENCPWGEAFRRGYIAGLAFFGMTTWWIVHVSVPGAVATIAFLALYFGAAAAVFAMVRTRIAGTTLHRQVEPTTPFRERGRRGGWLGLLDNARMGARMVPVGRVSVELSRREPMAGGPVHPIRQRDGRVRRLRAVVFRELRVLFHDSPARPSNRQTYSPASLELGVLHRDGAGGSGLHARDWGDQVGPGTGNPHPASGARTARYSPVAEVRPRREKNDSQPTGPSDGGVTGRPPGFDHLAGNRHALGHSERPGIR